MKLKKNEKWIPLVHGKIYLFDGMASIGGYVIKTKTVEDTLYFKSKVVRLEFLKIRRQLIKILVLPWWDRQTN